MLIKIILALALFYIVAMLAIYFAQSLFIYVPNIPTRELITTPGDAGLNYDEVSLITEDNEVLHAWYIHAPAPTDRTVLFMHGNAGNISHRMKTIKIFHQLGLNFFIFDYRGYGKSTGRPSEKGTYLDAEAAWKYLVHERNLTAQQIILAGRSLGGGVAAELAKNRHPAMLILESTFTSMLEISKHYYPFMPTDLIVKRWYETLDKIQAISCPIVVVHSEQDEVIPFSHGRLIFERANTPKHFITLRGGHDHGFLLAREDYVAGLRQALETLLQ